MRALLLALLLISPVALAKQITVPIEFSQACMTVDGDSLDTDGDPSVCELLTGFRVFDADGNFVTAIVEDGTRSINVEYNAPVWNTVCFKMTSYMVNPNDPNDTLESAFSNTGACVEVRPGKPTAPNVEG